MTVFKQHAVGKSCFKTYALLQESFVLTNNWFYCDIADLYDVSQNKMYGMPCIY